MSIGKHYDVAVIGAGVFGAWTSWHLTKRGQRVLLVEGYGPAHSRASSGGETRIIRMGYGADEIYTRWSQRSLIQWKELFASAQQPLFHRTGVLWLAGKDARRLEETAATLRRCGIRFDELDLVALGQRYPQIHFSGVTRGLFEPGSGVLLARRAVAAVVEEAIRLGCEYMVAHVNSPHASKKLTDIETGSGEKIEAEQFVFACGPWLGKLFPELLGVRVFPTRQEIFFFGVPAGDAAFSPTLMPTFLFQQDEVYGMPDIESRGLKIACDKHGGKADPDTMSRIVCEQSAKEMRAYVAHRFPRLKDAPIVETRVCQYENTSSGDFLIDRHPETENVWLVGGGSGHGFKHGPAVGKYVAAQILDGTAVEPRFQLAAKETVQRRAIY
ncbi:MAG TPA: N-methyl-L-tryptophan oxidase [Candidatus Acidoferrum sp.]|nr:N-methyl-L-tryptophan oxidase [Candidatus Acidoferrum sp.]